MPDISGSVILVWVARQGHKATIFLSSKVLSYNIRRRPTKPTKPTKPPAGAGCEGTVWHDESEQLRAARPTSCRQSSRPRPFSSTSPSSSTPKRVVEEVQSALGSFLLGTSVLQLGGVSVCQGYLSAYCRRFGRAVLSCSRIARQADTVFLICKHLLPSLWQCGMHHLFRTEKNFDFWPAG